MRDYNLYIPEGMTIKVVTLTEVAVEFDGVDETGLDPGETLVTITGPAMLNVDLLDGQVSN